MATSAGETDGQKSTMLTNEKAIAIARKAIEGKIEIQRGAPVTVERRGGHYVVTFVHINPPGTRGADYAAQVSIDAETGGIVKILVGS